ncbi:MoaD family protein [Caldisphaera lagunensis DSM 15908]|uniref:MoaD family protein n=1 Tax=Caldisphaera lagunensis (strain DSM 15908 / JCM 11604 / ANMR 0165 / IC-154) TaxID=1056495 RepID=L0AAA0_CALLD|nr:MoaD/ThiS family protein [Caldisphaera lagunensis]AFZ70047.1 MoaD family protein [Caldisphaera lagunensis DSM 15908]
MKIKVLTMGTLYMITKKFETEIEFKQKPKLIDVINYMIENNPKIKDQIMSQGKLVDNVSILINGREYRYMDEGINTGLKDGDVIAIVPPAGGGIK